MDSCLLCRSPDLDPLYQPIGTRRGITVHLCKKCGLLQSLPRQTKGDGLPDTSALASYGSLRIGKISRASPNLAFFRSNLPGWRPKRVLDAGASRGAFIDKFRQWLPDSTVMAIEPDTRVWPEYKSTIEYWKPGRIEDYTFFGEVFDLTYMSHTLEHLDNPLATLKKLRLALAPNGWLLVEVPNIRGLMGILDIVEEIYLDKHVCHFSKNTLCKMLGAAGLYPKYFKVDEENITILAKRGGVIPIPDDYESQSIRPIVQAYASDLVKNREALKGKVWRLNRLVRNEGKPALISGGGRILSALVEAGLDTMLFEGVVDPWLPLDEVHGLPVLSNPKMIGYVKPKVILVCSRSSAEAMAGEAVGWMPGCRVIRWNGG